LFHGLFTPAPTTATSVVSATQSTIAVTSANDYPISHALLDCDVVIGNRVVRAKVLMDNGADRVFVTEAFQPHTRHRRWRLRR
jgi:hypothetical protein